VVGGVGAAAAGSLLQEPAFLDKKASRRFRSLAILLGLFLFLTFTDFLERIWSPVVSLSWIVVRRVPFLTVFNTTFIEMFVLFRRRLSISAITSVDIVTSTGFHDEKM
jgi:hypothetical protein